ncbi:hypothetical protein C7S18_08640 [Ahniella affigens]|uniref:Tyr recombinase domain-containing protein n=1 Tax=Ahniella affigens TaxID=2021234 RepID=A0A2P1PQX6_9GAMM|nr:hypothetical protein C7S18_08640 [Ahniella affigens]
MRNAPLKLPAPFAGLSRILALQGFSEQSIAAFEAVVLNGFRAGEVAALQQQDVDLSLGRIRRSTSGDWLPLRTERSSAWRALADPVRPRSLFFRSRSGGSLSRISIWRILRKAGEAAGLAEPLNIRQARATLGHALGQIHALHARTLATSMGLRDARSVQRYLMPCDADAIPSSPRDSRASPRRKSAKRRK